MTPTRPVDRLQPSLLDRLRDDDPSTTAEPPEASMLNKAQLREAVLRDLAWLFNSARLEDSLSLEAYPEARRSVLNFGLPTLSGRTTTSVDIVSLEAEVKRAITEHEPRILPESLRVEAVESDDRLQDHNQIAFRISGQLWSQPVPLELLLRTQIDLETGRVNVAEMR